MARARKRNQEPATDQAEHHPTPEGPVMVATAEPPADVPAAPAVDTPQPEATGRSEGSDVAASGNGHAEGNGQGEKRAWKRNFAFVTSHKNGDIQFGEDRKFHQVYIEWLGKSRPTDEQKAKMDEVGMYYRQNERRWQIDLAKPTAENELSQADAADINRKIRQDIQQLAADFGGVTLGAGQSR